MRRSLSSIRDRNRDRSRNRSCSWIDSAALQPISRFIYRRNANKRAATIDRRPSRSDHLADGFNGQPTGTGIGNTGHRARYLSSPCGRVNQLVAQGVHLLYPVLWREKGMLISYPDRPMDLTFYTT